MNNNLVAEKPASRLPWGAFILTAALLVFILAPLPLLDKFYTIGFGICPQRPGHSYFMGETLLPGEGTLRGALPAFRVSSRPWGQRSCRRRARMYGMFAGFLLTLVYSYLIGRGRAAVMPGTLIMFTYITFIAFMGVDGVNATIFDLHNAGLPIPYAYVPRLDVRFITGWLCGIAMAGIILPVVNYCLWRDA